MSLRLIKRDLLCRLSCLLIVSHCICSVRKVKGLPGNQKEYVQ